MVPTSGGGVPSGGDRPAPTGTGTAKLKGLPPAVVGALKQIASSPQYGAPTTQLPTNDAAVQQLEPTTSGSFLSSTASAVGTATRDRLFGLAVVLLVVPAAAIAMAAGRQRRRLESGRVH
jgi:hypothetical protein